MAVKIYKSEIKSSLISEVVSEKIILQIRKLIGHEFIQLVTRGNSAIDSALGVVPKDKIVLIPEEGGWLHYRKAPKKIGLKCLEVKCSDAKINLDDLKEKLSVNKCGAFLYQNPGGYFAEQPMEEIYELCKKQGCLVIMDVSGAIGTRLCNGKYADIIVCSFGKWKLVEAKAGGFISAKDKKIFEKMRFKLLEDGAQFKIILEQLNKFSERIKFLQEKRKKIISELKDFEIVHPNDLGFVAVVKFSNEREKNRLIDYCKKNALPFTECPRYIRLNKLAICIEVKQL